MSGALSDVDGPVHIPSRELTGAREAKLAQLDSFLAQLYVVRLALSGEPLRLSRLEPAHISVSHRARAHSWDSVVERIRRLFRGGSRHRSCRHQGNALS
jgi:hypothetical protein